MPENLIACDGTTGLSDVEVQRELGEKLQRCLEELLRVQSDIAQPSISASVSTHIDAQMESLKVTATRQIHLTEVQNNEQ